MTSKTLSFPYLKLPSKHSCARSAASANPRPARTKRATAKVCLRLTWPYILKKARSPLHVSQILERIQTHFGITVDRESLVSSLTKKVARGDRFLRPEKNTFSLRPEAR